MGFTGRGGNPVICSRVPPTLGRCAILPRPTRSSITATQQITRRVGRGTLTRVSLASRDFSDRSRALTSHQVHHVTHARACVCAAAQTSHASLAAHTRSVIRVLNFTGMIAPDIEHIRLSFRIFCASLRSILIAVIRNPSRGRCSDSS